MFGDYLSHKQINKLLKFNGMMVTSWYGKFNFAEGVLWGRSWIELWFYCIYMVRKFICKEKYRYQFTFNIL